jgi:hypothetical protein
VNANKVRRLASIIADDLLTDCDGRQAVRLQLRGPGETDMGGLCRDALVYLISKILIQECSTRKKCE